MGVYVYTLVCLLVFVFVTGNKHGFACVFCVCACAWSLRVALSRENEELHIAWNSQAWFWKKGPQHLLMSPPLHSCAASPLACTGPSICLMVFDGQEHDGHETVFTQQPKGTNRTALVCLYVCVVVTLCIMMLCSLCFSMSLP